MPRPIHFYTIARRPRDANLQARIASAMPRKFLGVTFGRWIEYLVAILAGNAIFYYSISPHLPETFRHRAYQIDWGYFIDFAICVGVFGLIRLRTRL